MERASERVFGAEFMLHRGGAAQLKSRVSSAVGEPVSIEEIIPEYEVRFDEFGRGRVHDIGIFGETASGKSVFVGLEAKVDESFGPSVSDAYLKAKSKQITGTSTNAPERIEKLLSMHFSESDPRMFNVRYQLLYATAGTLAQKADMSVLYVTVFKTPLYDEALGAKNYRDYIYFMVKVGAQPLALDVEGVIGHELYLGKQRLICLHECFDLKL